MSCVISQVRTQFRAEPETDSEGVRTYVCAYRLLLYNERLDPEADFANV